ncbi:MAG: hypothetical protein AAFU79_25365, partial [Myxococcota bacterium]
DSAPSEEAQVIPVPETSTPSVREDALFRLATAYTDFAGPAARINIREEVRRMGHTSRTVPETDLDRLIARLADKLGEGKQRKAFLRKLDRLGVR